MFGEHINIAQALFVTLLSMGTVFVILAVIAVLLGYFEHLFSDRKSMQAAEPVQQVEKQDVEAIEEKEDPALVAVITAAIMASQTASYPIRISKIRRVGESKSSWQMQE